ncbi:hypothetical protein ACFL56_03025 [Candidatus Margulisiibacteriota bacterium]
MFKKGGILFIILLLLSSAVSAFTNYQGVTGELITPTAFSLKYKEFALGIDNYTMHNPSENIYLNTYKGAIGFTDNLELGFIGQEEKDGVYLNLKYSLVQGQSERAFGFALGLENVSSTQNTALYMVASKRFEPWIMGSLGFRAAQENTTTFINLDWTLNEYTFLIIEAEGGDGEYDGNAGIRFRMNEQIYLNIGFVNIVNGHDNDTYANFVGIHGIGIIE